MAIINMHDAKSQLSDLVARAEAGEEIVIARRNKPVVRLVKVEAEGVTQRYGFAESEQAEYDLTGLQAAVEAGKEYTIMQGGKVVAKVAPVEKKSRVPGRFAHLRGNLPSDVFDQPLSEDDLDAWDGKYSGDGDR